MAKRAVFAIARPFVAIILSAVAGGAFAQVENPGFEAPSMAANSWQYRPANVPGWSFSGYSGMANGSTPWGAGAHAGSQYAFLESAGNPGAMSQTIPGFAIGHWYRMRLWMKTRESTGGTSVAISMDGQTVMTPTLAYPDWTEHASEWFQATATAHTFVLAAASVGADVTNLIDDITIEESTPPPFGLPANPSFETPAYPIHTWFYQPPGLDLGWTFSTGAGLACGSGSWGDSAQDGQQYAFIQGNNAISQQVGNFEVGRTYHLVWYMQRRNGNVGGNVGQPIRVLYNDQEIFPLTLYDSLPWRRFISAPFVATAPIGWIGFVGGPPNGDRTELIDNVQIVAHDDFGADVLEVVTGFPFSGDIGSVAFSDDQYLIVRPDFSFSRMAPPIQVLFEATAPITNPELLGVAIESACTFTGVTQRLEFWDFQGYQWVNVGQSQLTTVDQVASFGASGNLSRFIDPVTHKLWARASVFPPNAAGPRSWVYRIDRIRFSSSSP